MVGSVKSLLCLILSSVLLFSFAGCGSNSGESSQTTADTTQTTAQPVSTATADTAPSVSQEATYNCNKIKQNSDNIKKVFDDTIAKNKFRGTVYVKIGNDFEYIGTNGFADKSGHIDNSLNTCYRIGSLTKQFTAAAIMLLQEQDKLSVNDTIDKYFPSYGEGKNITIKNLLNMTAGLKDYMSKDGSVDNSFYITSQLKYNVSNNNSASENKSAIMDWIFEQELNFEPGTQYQFSNSGYYLLGDIIENVSGDSYEKFITDNILKPLNMNSTGFDSVDGLATGYQSVLDNEWMLYPGVAYSSSGIISNVSDLLKWVDAFTGTSVLSENSLNEMTTLEEPGSYGYGFFVEGSSLTQNGAIDKFNSKLTFTKDESLVYIALSNYTQSDPTDILSKMINTMKPFYG